MLPQPPRRGRLALVVLVGVLLVVGVLTWASWSIYDHNEQNLLDLKAKEAASVLTAAVPSIQTPLASASALADATQGDPKQFDQLMAPYVKGGRPFVSASLWSLSDLSAGPVATVGSAPVLASEPNQAAAFFARASHTSVLSVTGILGSQNLRLGYEFNAAEGSGGYAAYVESALPHNRKLALASNTAFSDLNFALFVGRSAQRTELLETTIKLPTSGRQATVVVPFGDSAFTLLVTPKGPLSGSFSERLPWIIAVGGTALALLGAFMTDRLVRRRQQAELLAARLDRVAGENRRLYTEQRTIAQTLQHALLPDRLPDLDGVEAASRYVPGVQGIDIGGDWYDLIPMKDGQALFVVGDVSGRGLRAAAIMAALRYAVRAYAAQGDAPESILAKLSALISVEHDGHFATVLCGRIDIRPHTITVANAGHLPPLLVSGDTREFVATSIGLPVGIAGQPVYIPVTITVPPEGIFLAFTDGLVERRGEGLDIGLERLRSSVNGRNDNLEGCITTVLNDLTVDGCDDDAAILGVKWRT